MPHPYINDSRNSPCSFMPIIATPRLRRKDLCSPSYEDMRKTLKWVIKTTYTTRCVNTCAFIFKLSKMSEVIRQLRRFETNLPTPLQTLAIAKLQLRNRETHAGVFVWSRARASCKSHVCPHKSLVQGDHCEDNSCLNYLRISRMECSKGCTLLGPIEVCHWKRGGCKAGERMGGWHFFLVFSRPCFSTLALA